MAERRNLRQQREAEERQRQREQDEQDGETHVDQSAAQTEPDAPVFEYCLALQEIAEELIGERRTDLMDCHIAYLLTGQEHKRSGVPILQTVRKVSPLEAFFFGDELDVAVIFDRKQWLAGTQLRWRHAAVFDALARITVKIDTENNATWALRTPTVQTFPEVLQAFGAWNEPLAGAAEIFRQLPLLPEEAAS